MNKKRSYIIVTSLLLTVFLLAAFMTYVKEPVSTTLAGDISLRGVVYENIDDLIKNADNIVIGKVDKEELFQNSLYKFTFLVENQLKGNTNAEKIDVYQTKGELSEGNTYILFLEVWESQYYQNPVYTTIQDDTIIKLANNKLNGNIKYTGNKTEKELIKYIEKSSFVKVKKEKNFDVINKIDSIAELIGLSDNIIHVIPTEINSINKNVSRVKFDVIEQFKGNIDIYKSYLLPNGVEIGEEYIIFMRETKDGVLLISTRDGSIISKNDINLWNETLTELRK